MAEAGATRPIHIHTMKTFSSLELLGRGLIDLFREKQPMRWSFEDWISHGSEMKVFEFDIDSKETGKLMGGSTLWKLIRKEAALHPDVASAMLFK